MDGPSHQSPSEAAPPCPGVRWGLAALGWACVGLGMLGAFLPLLPSTVFFIVALWAFTRSSPRVARWLYEHPRLGPPLRAWHRERAIAPAAKALAIAMMTASVALLWLTGGGDWLTPAIVGALLLPVAGYVVTRPHPIAG